MPKESEGPSEVDMTPRPEQYLHLEETPETPIFRRNEQLNSQKQNTVQRRLTKTRRGMGGGGHILVLQMQTREVASVAGV